MALETGSYINDLVITNPAASDLKSQGDDHLRLLKVVLKECLNGFSGSILLTATDTGTAAAHVLTPTTALVGYTTGLMLLYRPTNAGTGALTVNVSGLGAKSVKMSNGSDPASGDILVNQPLLLMYDGTNFVAIGGSAFLAKTGNQTLNGNLQVTGIAQVNGAATVGGTLGVTGNTTVGGTLNVSGVTTIPATGLGFYEAVNRGYADALAFAAALPTQTGNAGKFVTTDGTSASWAVAKSVTRRAITTTDTAVLTDQGNLIDVTSGTFTLAFSAVATLGNGWYCYIRNSGTGDVTLDPNASETIDGLTSFVMYPSEVRLVQCDGTALRSIVIQGFYRTFTATGTFTKPPGYSVFSGLLWGGGGSGGKQSTNASGGGGGACNPFSILASSFGASETITIGAGGVAQNTNATDGNIGGNSTIGSLCTSYGGGAGNGVNGGSNLSGGSGGGTRGVGTAGTTGQRQGGQPSYSSATVGTLNIGFGGGGSDPASNGGVSYYGGSGGGGSSSAGAGSDGGASEYGGAGGGGRGSTTDGSGGVSVHGGNGGAAANASSGVAGAAPGGGGGATRTGTQSGAGGRGECRIWGIV